jgi:hypothetical protein
MESSTPPASASDDSPTRSVWPWATLVLALGLALPTYAIWSRPFAPLVDLPNHMARHLLEARALAGHELPAGYALELRPVPNLGGDLIVPALMLVFEPITACKVFLTLAVMLYWLGPAVFLWRHHGGATSALCAALLLLPFSFSSHFFWGFLNYYSGMGLAFLALAHFDRLARAPRLALAPLLLHALVVLLLFFWHLAPWVVYCVIMECYLLVLSWDRYRAEGDFGAALARGLGLMLPLLPALVFFAIYFRSNAGVNPQASYDWGGAWRKVVFVANLFRAASWQVDLVVVLLWLSALATWFGADVMKVWRWQRLHLAIAALMSLYLLLGAQMGTTADNDSRVLPALLVCAVSLVGVLPMRRVALGFVLLGVCLVFRYGSVIHLWDTYSRRLEVHEEALARLEPGDRVLPIVLVPDQSPRYPEQHFVCWSVPLRETFVPTLFAHRDQQPLRITVDRPRTHFEGPEGVVLDGIVVSKFYDVVWVDNRTSVPVRVPERFEAIYQRGSLTLWRVR